MTEEKQKNSSVRKEYKNIKNGQQCVKHTNKQQLFFIKAFFEKLFNREIGWCDNFKNFLSNQIIRFKRDDYFGLSYSSEIYYTKECEAKIWSFEEFVEIFDEEIKKCGLQEELHKILHPKSAPITKDAIEFISKSVDLEKSENSIKNKDIFIRPVIKTKEKMDLTLENFTLKFVNIPISQKPVKKVPGIKVEIFKLNY